MLTGLSFITEAGRKAAIVSPTAGTTRDVISVWMDIGGFPVTVLDTAGIRASADPIEMEGVEMARERFLPPTQNSLPRVVQCSTESYSGRFASSDLKICLFDGSTYPKLDAETLRMIDGNTIVVLNKTDLMPHSAAGNHRQNYPGLGTVFQISCKTGAGIDSLALGLEERLKELYGHPPPHSVVKPISHALNPTTEALHRLAVMATLSLESDNGSMLQLAFRI